MVNLYIRSGSGHFGVCILVKKFMTIHRLLQETIKNKFLWSIIFWNILPSGCRKKSPIEGPRPTRHTRVETAESWQLCIGYDTFPPQTASCCYFIKKKTRIRTVMKWSVCLPTPHVRTLLKEWKPTFFCSKRRCTRSRIVYAVAVQIQEYLRDFWCNVYSLVNERVLINSRLLGLLIY